MHPEVGERHAGVGLGLRDLVLVVREDEVRAAAVDLERLAEVLGRHRRALDVPARTAGAPGARPRRLARLGALPEREVVRALLRGVDLLARLHVVEAAVREFAVRGEAAHAEVDTPVGDRVREARADQPLDQGEHRGDVRGRARLVRRRQAGESRDIFVELPGGARGQFGNRNTLFHCGGGAARNCIKGRTTRADRFNAPTFL